MTTSATDLRELTGTYSIDPAHSQIGFIARHAMVTKVRGSFDDFEGTVHVDGAEPGKSNVAVTLQVASVNTRNEQRDAHLRTNDFFQADEFPTITFASTAVEQSSADEYTVTGDLTIKGVTKSITIPLEFQGSATDPFGNVRIGFEGSTVVNRKDWGVSFNVALEAGGMLVSEKITLEFEISAIKSA